MSYKFDANNSYGRLRQYTSQVIGGLEARPQTATLSTPFRELRKAISDARAAREEVDDAVLAASARLRVNDADWDQAILAVSARAFELARKRADADPYATLFGRIDAKRARSLGAAKAQIVGQSVVRDGRRLDQAGELQAVLDALDAATVKLSETKAAYDEADDALFAPRRSKKKLVSRLNDAIAVAEAGILTAFPGRGDLVSAILLPWFERRGPKTRNEAGDGPDQPDVPDLDDEPADTP